MSDSDEHDEKITVLFPDRQPDEKPELATTDDHQEGRGELEEYPDQEATETGDDHEEVEPRDNVVELEFGREESPGTGEASEPADEALLARHKVFEKMIDEGMVMVTLDTRVEGVEVPPEFEGLPELRLNFSHMFHIADFDYDARGVRASLSFQGTRSFCDVPWSAVRMIYSHETGELAVFESIEN